MKPLSRLTILSCFVLVVTPARAQHCPPILESYLSQISIKHNRKDRSLDLNVTYSKGGGHEMPKYQIYLLAYLQKNEHRVPTPLPADFADNKLTADFIDKKFVCVLHTEAIELNNDDNLYDDIYDFDLRLNMNELAEKIIKLGRFTEKDRINPDSWGYYEDKFRLAVFIPYLEDSTYSVLDSLPEDKHECPHSDRRALLFQPLPYAFSIQFGRPLTAPGDYVILIDYVKPIERRE